MKTRRIVDMAEKKIRKLVYLKGSMAAIKEGWKISPNFIILTITYSLIKGMLPLFNIFFIKEIIAEITGDGNLKNALFYALFLCLSVFLFSCSNVFIEWSKSNYFIKMGDVYNVQSGEKIMNMDYKNLEDPEVMNKFGLSYRASFAVPNICEQLGVLVSSVIQIFLYIAIVFTLSPLLPFLFLAFYSINYMISKRTEKASVKIDKEQSQMKRYLEYLLSKILSPVAGKDIRLFSGETLLMKHYNHTTDDLLKSSRKKQVWITRSALAGNFLSGIQTALMYLSLIYKYFINVISIAEFSFYLGSMHHLTAAFRAMSLALTTIYQNYNFLEIFNEYKNMSNTMKTFSTKTIEENLVVIQFHNVFFRYPNSNHDVLKNINLTIHPKEKISIVGANGAGKTTFLKLLIRLYDPTKGKITLNGTDIKELSYDAYMDKITTVFQDFKLFAYTIQENIIFDQCRDTERLTDILRKTNLFDKVNGLPNGIHSYYTKSYDPQGIVFSGGESQKLAIARSYYKNAAIAILDEPTAAIDPISEYRIYQSANEVFAQMSTIFISHRLTSSKFCDFVVYFKDGQIKETGTHDSLIKKNGAYAQMYQKQAIYYVD